MHSSSAGRMSDAQASAPSAAEPAPLVGRHVIVRGLAKRPELNGLCAFTEKVDPKTGRYATRLPMLAHPILLKQESLEIAPSATAAISAAAADEHRDEVKERVRAAVAGERHESSELVVLDLEHTGLTALPEVVGTLSEIRELWLAGNTLEQLPPAVGCLVKLRNLDLDGNALQALPSAIEHLTALEALYCNSNRLVAVPDSIGKLRALRELRLSDNRLGAPGVCLGALPEEFGSLRSLRVLWLARNSLSTVPDAVCRLSGLEELDLAGNALVALPKAIAKLRHLTSLDLHGNDALVWPPSDVTSQGAQAVRTWLEAAPEPEPPAEADDDDASDESLVERARRLDAAANSISYEHEAPGSMHQPLPLRDEPVAGDASGGEFIFPGDGSMPRMTPR